MSRLNIPVMKDRNVNELYPGCSPDEAFVLIAPSGEASYEGEFALGEDQKTVIVFINESRSVTAKCVLKAGNGMHGVKDLSVVVMPNTVVTVTPDAGRFKIVSGEDRGKVVISDVEGEDFKVAVFEAP